MKKILFIAIFTLTIITLFTNCSKEKQKNEFVGIKNISFENYPKVDGSTSASLLNSMVACKLLGIHYEWSPGIVGEWGVQPNWDELPEQYKSFFGNRIKSSQTHGAFMNLIDGNADIILTHRTISTDEKAHADAAGVTLIETPIASDAFAFVVNKSNPVNSLTIAEIQKIYTGNITNWSEVGGNDADIKVFTRPRNSGSEEVFRELVMQELEPGDFPQSPIASMFGVFREMTDKDAICYTFNNYKNLQARIPDSEVPKISVNGVFPDNNTIMNESYPFISRVHIAIRSDLDHNAMAYKLYEWLQSANAKSTLAECGFVVK